MLGSEFLPRLLLLVALTWSPLGCRPSADPDARQLDDPSTRPTRASNEASPDFVATHSRDRFLADAQVHLRRTEASAPPSLPATHRADLDPLNDMIVGPPAAIEACELELKRAGVKTKAARIRPHTAKSGDFQCGAAQIVRYLGGPGNIRYRKPPRMTCGLALAMAAFESIVQDEAMRHFGQGVAEIVHGGTYNCREIRAYAGWVSEHSYANAIDIKSFRIRKGPKVSVLEHFSSTDPAHAKHREFLHRVARRVFDEHVFSVVLTPHFDRAHRDHFHFDLARYRTDGARP